MNIVEELPKLTFYRGRVGLYAILKAMGVGPGDLVATQAFTCLAVPEGIMATGAKPLFVDTEEGGVNMCPTDLRTKMSDQVKAVIVQHTFGIPAQLSPIMEVLQEHHCPLIEDCCHTFATTYVNQLVGTFGAGSFYSFEWGKPIIAGIGGSAIVNDSTLHSKVVEFQDSLAEPSWKRTLKIQLQYFGFRAMYRPSNYWRVRAMFQKLARAGAAEGNYNPTDGVAEDFGLAMARPLRARLLRGLSHASEFVERSKRLAAEYDSAVVNSLLTRPRVPDGGLPVYSRFPLLALEKERLLARAEEANIEVADWYKTPVHPLNEEDWKSVNLEPGACPRAETLSRKIVSLPINHKVQDSDVKQTAQLLNSL